MPAKRNILFDFNKAHSGLIKHQEDSFTTTSTYLANKAILTLSVVSAGLMWVGWSLKGTWLSEEEDRPRGKPGEAAGSVGAEQQTTCSREEHFVNRAQTMTGNAEGKVLGVSDSSPRTTPRRTPPSAMVIPAEGLGRSSSGFRTGNEEGRTVRLFIQELFVDPRFIAKGYLFLDAPLNYSAWNVRKKVGKVAVFAFSNRVNIPVLTKR